MNNIPNLSREKTAVNLTGDRSGSSLDPTAHLEDISTAVTATINQLPSLPEPGGLGIKELLWELQEVVEAEPQMSSEDKVAALAQIQNLAAARLPAHRDAAAGEVKRAMIILKGMAASQPNAVQFSEACNKLLRAIKVLVEL